MLLILVIEDKGDHILPVPTGKDKKPLRFDCGCKTVLLDPTVSPSPEEEKKKKKSHRHSPPFIMDPFS